MIVAVAATELEMAPFLRAAGGNAGKARTLVTGVGPVETAVRLGRCLATAHRSLTGLFQVGVGGASIVDGGGARAELLDVCLAESEVLGDYGVCLGESMRYFPEELGTAEVYPLDAALARRAGQTLTGAGIPFRSGNFVTVNGLSGTAARGVMLQRYWQALCENMEGAAAVRLCREYRLPMVEMRVISNLVVEREQGDWRLQEACARAGEVAARLLGDLI